MEEKNYLDEELLQIRNNYQQTKKEMAQLEQMVPNDITNGWIDLDGERMVWSRRDIDQKLSVFMPDSFQLMDPMAMELKYAAYKNPKKLIFTNEGTTIHIIFDFQTTQMAREETEEVRDQLLQVVKKMHPSATVMELSAMESEGVLFAYFEIITPALDGEIYNLMFFFEWKGSLCMGTFHCLETEKHNWMEPARQMVNSIRIL